ncbi:MAG: 4Fe-4S binding protein [Candidatus Kapabacteria bacterium]|nr:4Fe-4S binding protein [Candidatus Kapabacteria bacterium]
MAMKISDDCISCGACEAECPVGAIYAGDEHNEVDPAKCVECKGYFDEPQCAANCPVEAISKA